MTAPVTEYTGNTKAVNSWPELALPANEWKYDVSGLLKLVIINRS